MSIYKDLQDDEMPENSEQKLEQLLMQLSELPRHDTIKGPVVFWSDLEEIIKQNFPDDEFH